MTMAAAQSLINTGTRHDIVIMHSPGVQQINHTRINAVQLRSAAKTKGRFQWSCTFDKLWAARLTTYEKIIFLDSDVMILKNMDHLFTSTTGALTAPVAYWLRQPFVTSGGPLVMKTSDRAFSDVLESRSPKQYDGEMDYINTLNINHIGPEYTVLIGNWCTTDRVFDMFSLKRTYLVHFVASWKPPVRAAALKSLTHTGRAMYTLWRRSLRQFVVDLQD